jgi:hypothetical protein
LIPQTGDATTIGEETGMALYRQGDVLLVETERAPKLSRQRGLRLSLPREHV